MRTVKKSTTVDYIVDITNAQSAADVYLTIAAAKLTQNELDVLADRVAPKVTFQIVQCPCHCGDKLVEKKPNIFKRFWNWVTGK